PAAGSPADSSPVHARQPRTTDTATPTQPPVPAPPMRTSPLPVSLSPSGPAEARSTAGYRVRVRWRLDVSYDGTDFHGWAAQPGLRTVQGVLEDALYKVLRLASPPTTTCAGRTDAGVHARGQVVHLDAPDGSEAALIAPARLRPRLARVLPGDARVVAAQPAPDGVDARFSALRRRYVYRLCDDPAGPDPLVRRHVTAWRRGLDVDAMDSAA